MRRQICGALLGGLSQGNVSGWSDGVWVVGMLGLGGGAGDRTMEAGGAADSVVEGVEAGNKVGTPLGMMDGKSDKEDVGGGSAGGSQGWGGSDE